MNQPTSTGRIVATIASALFALAVCGTALAQSTKAAPPRGTVGAGQGGGMDMRATMMQGAQQMRAMPATGDVDRDFATMMRMHHQAGIDMAQVELRQGKDPKMKEVARSIVATQQKEIREFDDWLAKHPH